MSVVSFQWSVQTCVVGVRTMNRTMHQPRREVDELFAALGRSRFRSRFRLGEREQKYLSEKGLDVILEHARTFLGERLAPAEPKNDGKQTPFRGHPVFIAQHATATCCRGCLEKWHRIPRGRPLSDSEIDYVVGVLRHWLSLQQP